MRVGFNNSFNIFDLYVTHYYTNAHSEYHLHMESLVSRWLSNV